MEKHIRVSTQGRLTIPKQMRDLLGISKGQPILLRTNSAKREITIALQPTMSDFK